MQKKNAEKIKNYLNAVKDLEPYDKNIKDLQDEYQNTISQTLFDGRWRGYKYAASPAYYEMHKDISEGVSYDVIINTYKHIIHDKKRKRMVKEEKDILIKK